MADSNMLDDQPDSVAVPVNGYPPPGGGGALSMAAPMGGSVAQRPTGSPTDAINGALSQLTDPKRQKGLEDLAFWAGATAPNMAGTPMASIGNALGAQVQAREKAMQLQGQYIPMIMQSMAQQRANDVQYSRLAMDRQKELAPQINSALGALPAGGAQPNVQQAIQRIMDVGGQYGASAQELMPHIQALIANAGQDGNGLGTYLSRLNYGAAAPADRLPKQVTLPSGQLGQQGTMANTVSPASSQGGAGASTENANPSKLEQEGNKAYMGDVDKYSTEIQNNLGAYNDMAQRMNVVNDAMSQFTPGKYAGMAGGFAAAMKDLQARFPNVATSSLSAFAKELAGPGANPVAYQQLAAAVKTQEALAQIKTAMSSATGSAGRILQTEYNNTFKSLPGGEMDPEAFAKFRTYTLGQQQNAINKAGAWSQYLDKTPAGQRSTWAFEFPWQINEAKQLQQGKYGDVTSPAAVAAPAPGGPAVAQSASQAQPSNQPAPQRMPVAQPAPVDLTKYPKGAMLSRSGRPFTMINGVPTYVQPLSREQSGQVQ